MKRLVNVEDAQARLEEEAREKVVRAGKPAEAAKIHPKVQANFTDPESRIMHTPDGFQQCFNAQAAVDAESQVIVAQEVSQAPPDEDRLRQMLQAVLSETRRIPRELSADAGYASEANFQALDDAGVLAVIALRRYRRDEPPDADPAPARSSGRWPQRNLMRELLATPQGKDITCALGPCILTLDLDVLQISGHGFCRQHAFQHVLQRHGVCAGGVAGEELAAAVPLTVRKADLVVVVLTPEVHAQALELHPVALSCVALCLFDLADDA